MSLLYKSIIGVVLSLPVVASGLVGFDGLENRARYRVPIALERKTYFTSIEGINNLRQSVDGVMESWALADMDGDGDLDILVARQDGMIEAYENRIPQELKLVGPPEQQ